MVEKETLHVRYCPYCPEHSKALLRDPTKVMSEDWWAGTKSSTPCTRTYINKHVLTASSRQNLKSINQSIKQTKERNKRKKQNKQTTSILLLIHPHIPLDPNRRNLVEYVLPPAAPFHRKTGPSRELTNLRKRVMKTRILKRKINRLSGFFS